MMKNFLLLISLCLLFLSVIFNIFIIYAIIITILIFFCYGIILGFKPSNLLQLMFAGILKSSKVFFVLGFIGIMSALWRSSGLTAYLVIKSFVLLYPPLFLAFAFILCSGFSFLIGSSFASVSIVGVLLISIAKSIVPVNSMLIMFTGGAIISGAFVGDRVSFLSSSAYLVASITGLKHKAHILNMLKQLPMPFLITVIIYALLSILFPFKTNDAKAINLLTKCFNINSIFIFAPLIIVFLPIITKLKLLHAIIASSIIAGAVSIFLQNQTLLDVVNYAIFGFYKPNNNAAILFGGGFVSMLKPIIIVATSSLLPPLIIELQMFDTIKNKFVVIANKTNTFFSAMLSGVLTSTIACSQTLAVFLQAPIVDALYDENENESKALAIANSSILFSAIVPWNVALAGVLVILDIPAGAALFAFYILLQPLYVLAVEVFKKNN